MATTLAKPGSTTGTAVTGGATAAAAQPKHKEWQRWNTVGADASATVLYQDSSGWLDLSSVVSIRITSHIAYAGGSAGLTLQTSNSPDGPWSTVNATALDTVGKVVLVVSSLSSNETYKARRYLRWSVSGGSANWEICFRFTYEVL